jgi:hypothetical protein
MKAHWLALAVVVVGAAFVPGCVENESYQPPVPGADEFQSADPNQQHERGYPGGDYADASASDGGADADAGSEAGPPEDPEDPTREIEEADIIKVVGDTLYALSAYRGLVAIDVSNPEELRMLGRYPTTGMPFEMYVRDGVAYVIYSSFWSYVYDEATGTEDWKSTSRIVALDVTDPGEMFELGTYDLAGEISDSRIVGDVLYAVAFESGWCWRCDGTPRTTVTSLFVADPASIALVDRLSYTEDGGYGWRRSISVTPERMYVSGVTYSSDWSSAHSTIQVVDISDPAGRLREGAEVPVAGQIDNRWQMDEVDDVLRVVSQPGGGWGSSEQPVVETFAVVSASDVRPLGRLAMVLPRPEQLMSVRFDGPQAYAVTFQQTDPLFTIDLSDPAHPVQRGELEIPGWLYHMEPRGDRLLAIGYDEGWSSGLAVSLFDVADLDHPTLLDRVAFGGDYGWMPEDQDRIHKAFRILDELGLILMPFAGWSHDDEGYFGNYESGVQIIDFTRDDLTLRGTIPHQGFARRAFLHRDRLFAMSDERVETYDIADRDHPRALDALTLARTVYRIAVVGEHVAELVSDWWTGEARLDVLPLDDPDGLDPVGTLDLSALRPAAARPYDYWSSGFSYYSSRMFAHGDHAYLLWAESGCSYWGYYGCSDSDPQTGLAVFDLADPGHPRLVSQARFPFLFPGQSGWWSSGTVEAGETIVQLGSTLVVRPASDWYWYYDDSERDPATLELLDLADPERPRHAATFRLPGGEDLGTLQVVDGLVVTSHAEPLDGEDGLVRFFLDRIDISNPSRPRRLAAINIPGSPVWYDPGAARLITVDYQHETRTATSWDDCYGASGWGWDAWYDDATGACTRLTKSLNLLEVEGYHAVLLHRIEFSEDRLRDVRVSADRVFVGTESSDGWGYWYDDRPTTDPRPRLLTFTGLQGGELELRDEVRMSTPGTWLFAARGTRAYVLSDYPPSLELYDATRAGSVARQNLTLLTGYGYDVQIFDGYVLTANASWGVQRIGTP